MLLYKYLKPNHYCMNKTLVNQKLSSQYLVSVFFIVGIILYWFLREQSPDVLSLFSLAPFFGLHSTGGSTSQSGSSQTGTGRSYNDGRTEASRNMSQNDFNGRMTAAGGTVTSSYGNYSTASFSDGSTASWSGNSNSSNSSTPFLLTWNGSHYDFENDFLFGKPNTAFNTYAEGLLAYKAGIGGDTYFLKNKLKAENGWLKFQIKEIEPEESFIDSFQLTAIDMPSTHHPVTDGNLTDTYIFDTTKTETLTQQSASLHTAINKKVFSWKNVYTKFGATQNGKDTTLHTGDKIIISLPVDQSIQEDVFLMVDSYFRDWTLGNQVPFTLAERTLMQTKLVTKMFPVWAATLMMAGFGLVAKNVSADIPYGGGGGGGGIGGGGGGNRSLVVTAKVGGEIVYLQTLFPRYVQASQEVVRIPLALFKKALGSTLEVYITATKKHKVRSAFLFKGTPTDAVVYTPLTLKSAIKKSVQREYATDLTQKNGDFLHTLPADVIDVLVEDSPLKEGYVRHYMLQAHGFYTKLSTQTKNKLGDFWYDRLDKDSKKLLKNLRVYKA